MLALSDNLSFLTNMALGRGYVLVFLGCLCFWQGTHVFPSYYYIKNIY